MDPPFMHSRRASTSMFSFKAAAETLKVKEEEEGYDDSAEEEEEGDEEGEEIEVEESYPKKKRMDLGGGLGKKGSTAVAGGGAGGGGVVAVTIPLPPGCQVDKCVADLTDSKRYHQRHKVCEYHSKAQVVMVAGLRQRFCQQCSRFHDLSEFDDAKRSCRRRLAGHNERRRKNFCESRGEGAAAGRRGSATQMDKKQCRQIDERGRSQIALSENTQNFHIH